MHINDPSRYYRSEHETLGWEVTVSMMLEEDRSPCRELLTEPRTFGHFLSRFLREKGVEEKGHFFELGGGYGTLARDVTRAFPDCRMTMMDISPAMLGHQKAILGFEKARFIEGGADDLTMEMLEDVTLFLCNEVVSDLVTVCNRGRERSPDEITRQEMKRFSQLLGLDTDEEDFFLNLGAMKLAENLCKAEVPRIWISEQSAEREPALVQGIIESPIIEPVCRPVQLHGHTEYPVRFSDLEHIARKYGYQVERGIYADIIPLKSELFTSLFAGNITDPGQEMKRQFVEDCYRYEYLFLVKD
jgi:hypothetical protein